MMELLCVLKCIIDGMTYHLLFHEEERKVNSLRNNIKNIGIFVLLILALIVPVSLFLPEELLSVLTIIFCTVYFYYQNKRIDQLFTILTSLLLFHFILLLTSFSALIIVGLVLTLFHIDKLAYDPFIRQVIILSVYLIFCLFLTFSGLIKMKTVRKIMQINGVSFLIALAWTFIVLIYFYFVLMRVNYNSRVILTSVAFFALIITFYVIALSCRLYEKYNARIAALQQVKGKSLDELRNENPKIWDALYEYFTVDLQISSGMKVFHQLIVAVLFVIVGGQKSYNLLKDIYPRVAELTGAKSAKSVAVNITNAIERIWGNAENAEHLAEVYPYPVSSKTGMPTNKEFIFCVADRMKKQLNLKENSEKVEAVSIF